MEDSSCYGSLWLILVEDIFKLVPIYRGVSVCNIGDGSSILFGKTFGRSTFLLSIILEPTPML
jgi:hypothetical protein